MIIGVFEIAIALLGLMILMLFGQFDRSSAAFLTLLIIYGVMGAGLLAIQEWARQANVILHLIAIPYTIFTSLFLGGSPGWRAVLQMLIALAIVFALSRSSIQLKFKTAVPKKRKS